MYQRLGWILSIFLFSLTIYANTTPGVVPINMSVSSQGQAMVDFPIDLPKLASGLSPNLGIAYYENYSSIILGRSFALNGFPSIHRCRETLEIAGQTSTLEAEQASYCLDGELLVVESVGSRSYKKLVDDNSLVTLVGEINNPTSWLVQTPDGFEYIYNRDEILPEDAVSGTRWLLKNVKQVTVGGDADNQTINFTYDSDSYYVKPITITYGDVNVSFNYEPSSTVESHFRHGMVVTDAQRLSSIEVNRAGQSLVEHSINYENAGGAGYRIESLTSCYNGKSTCLNPSRIEYVTQDATDALKHSDNLILEKSPSVSVKVPNLGSYTTGDIDGDGITDFCSYSVDEGGVICGNASTPFTVRSAADDASVDFTFIEKFYQEGNGIGSQYEDAIKRYSDTIRAVNSLTLIDLNNDGYDDYCTYVVGGRFNRIQYYHCALNQQDGTFGSLYQATSSYYAYRDGSIPHSNSFIDINYDGYVDICDVNRQTSRTETVDLQCHLNNKQGSFFGNTIDILKKYDYNPNWNSTEDYTETKFSQLFIDLNNDASPDYCYADRNKIECVLSKTRQLSGGDKILSLIDQPKVIEIDNAIIRDHLTLNTNEKKTLRIAYETLNFSDINGDNLPDICYLFNQVPTCMLNDGDASFDTKVSFPKVKLASDIIEKNQAYSEDAKSLLLRSLQYRDWDGDGLVDICWVDGASFMCALGESGGFSQPSAMATMQLSLDVLPSLSSRKKRKKSTLDYIGNGFVNVDRKTYYSAKDENSLAFGPISLINDTNGDGRNEVCYRSEQGIKCIDIARPNSNRVKATVDSLGLRKSVRYKSTLDAEVYSNQAGLKEAPSDRYRIINPVKEVVSNLYFDNGHDDIADDLLSIGMNETQFKYSAYSQNLDGYSPGFLKVEESNLVSNLRLTQHYYNDSKLIGELAQVDEFEIQTATPVLFKQTAYKVGLSPSGASGYFRQLQSKVVDQFDVNTNTSFATQTVTYSEFDSYNYPKRIIDVTSGLLASDTRTITNAITYDHKANLRLLGLREQELTTITSSSAEETLYPATKNLFDQYGRLTQQVKTIHESESISANYAGKLTTDYSNFDKFGQAQTIINTGKSSADANASDTSRTITRKYNLKGLLEFESNDKQHKTSYFYEGDDGIRCQQPTRITDANERPTQIGYDALCRQDKIINFDGSSISYDWQWDTSLNRGLTSFQGLFLNTPSVYRVTETEQLKNQRTSGEIKAQKITYLDRFQRQLRNIAIGNHDKAACADGAEDIFIDYAYDHMGRTSGVTKPYGGCFGGSTNTNTQVWQASHFDGHGRLTSEIKQTENGNSVMSYQYAGNTTTISLTSSNQAYEKIISRSIHGDPLSVDSAEGSMTFTRNGLGLVTSVNRNDLTTAIAYDDYGNKTSMNDPDMGAWLYSYNGFGELAQQTDANGKSTLLSYDTIGRLTDKTFDGSSWKWEYDPKNEKGALNYHLTSEGTKRQYKYDNLGRVDLDTLTVNSESYETSFVYDAANRVTDEIQPSGVTVHRDYDLMGRLLRVSMPRGAVKGYNLEVLEKAIAYLNSSIDILRTEVASNVAAAKVYAAEAKRLQTHALNLSNISNVDLNALENLNNQAAAAFAVKEAAEKRLSDSQSQLDIMRNRGMDHFVAIAKDNIGTIDLYHTKSYRRKETNGTKTGRYADSKTVKLIDTATKEGKEALAATGVKGNQCYRDFKRNSWGRWVGKNHCSAGIHPVNYYTYLTNALTTIWTAKNTDLTDKEENYKNIKSALQNQITESQEAMAKAKEAYESWRTNSLSFQAKQEELLASLNSRDELTTLKGELKDLDSQGNVMLWAATRYRPDGQLQSEQFGNGYRTHREFYPLSNRISRITTQLTQPIRDVEYSYDNRGNLVTKTGHVLNTLESYDYNDSNGPDRLTDWSWQQVGNADVQAITRNYSYNQYGGMTIDKGDDLVFDVASQRVDKVQSTDGTAIDYKYDKNGNVKDNGLGLNIQWNAFNKPDSITSSTTTRFTYQTGGQRVVKQIENGANRVEKTVYINPSLELVEENDSSGNNISHVWRHHIRVGNDVVATIEKSSNASNKDQADKVAFIHRDLLGNPETITDIHGNTLQVKTGADVKSSHRLYSPYGELLGYISETDEMLALDKGGIELTGTYRELLEAKTAKAQKVADLADLVSVRQRTIKSMTTLDASLTYTTLEEKAQAAREKKARADVARQAATTYIFIGGSIPIIIPLVDESKIPPPEPDAPTVRIASDLTGVANDFNSIASNINDANSRIVAEGAKDRERLDEPEGGGGKSIDLGNINAHVNANVSTQAVRISFAGYKAFAHKVEFTSVEKAEYQGSIAGGLRGFTSHEALAEHGLVHMNARIYDPKNGRFLSADTLIPNPNNWDSYNRYMYVEGNPMRYRDPSGHDLVSIDENTLGNNSASYDNTSGLDNFSTSIVIVTAGSSGGAVTTNSSSSVSVTAHSNDSGSARGWYDSSVGSTFSYSVDNRYEVTSWMKFVSGLPVPSQGLTDFAAGFGDGVSFGLTDVARDWMETNSSVNKFSSEYGFSKIAGQLNTSAILIGGFVLRPFTAQSQLVTQWTVTGSIGANTSWVMTGGRSYRNYIMAGGPELQASYSQSVSSVVSGGSLRWPSGVEWFKGFFGQRILK